MQLNRILFNKTLNYSQISKLIRVAQLNRPSNNALFDCKYVANTIDSRRYLATTNDPNKKQQQASTATIDATKVESTIKQTQVKIEEEKLKKELELALNSNKSFVEATPVWMQPYLKLMRLDKPIGTHVVFWPGAWAILGTTSYLHQTIPDFYMLGIFALGALTMRSAGCIINDIWDRNYDKNVERTRNRPLASGQIGLPGAFALLAANLSVSLYLLLQLNMTTQILGACALFPVAIYPSAKRFSDWPQLFLGLAINWGALMGWSAIICSQPTFANNIFAFLPALALYFGCINWTLFYDTIYANQDKHYDAKLGLGSTALTLQKRQKLWLLGFATMFSSNLTLFGYLTEQQPIYYGVMGLVYAHLLKQTLFVNLNSPESCHRQFKSNTTIGFLTALGFLLSTFISQ